LASNKKSRRVGAKPFGATRFSKTEKQKTPAAFQPPGFNFWSEFK
jgi:uncharacterized protein (DUF1800 family)